ncbi:STING domain-containing protein [Sulfitobacter guttiformis]|uniref:Prokaryotic STING domain-containing protein n=1 Tax=Sulfitobacter guttiformis TaxID=74349 RepID=A0A420DU83_9RHOB|nr:STING domain-containing protein [Sulfitobacter guttiformis]KIN71284.1 hypothetical protein Z949_443 [Sulfitobacter guttiformis KCTC 32187]RKE97740.1 hypothetical protein C8N30_2365 [Sulfitobacter guttiformis]
MFDFLSTRQWAWKLLWLVSFLAILTVLFSSIMVEKDAFPLSSYLSRTLENTAIGPLLASIGGLAQNDGIFGIVIGGLFSVLSISSIYILKIPNIRNTAVQALAWGYYENYLSNVVQKIAADTPNFRIVIVLPSYELVERPQFYWARLKVVISRLGFGLDNVRTDDVFGRDVFTIQKQEAPPLPLFVDLPSTMKVIRRILELEAHMPAGRVARQKWWRSRFKELRAEFRASLIDFFGDEDWGNLVFIEGDNTEQFAKDLRKVIAELEADIARTQKAIDADKS